MLGKTFTKQGLTALTGIGPIDLEPILAALLRKEVLSVQADPLSPERGQYAFLQDIVKRVAYETISRRERKAKHLATADYLLTLPGSEEDEIVDVVAQHLVDALESAPGCVRRRGDSRPGSCHARPRGRAGHLARRNRRGPTGVRAGGRSERRLSRAGGALRTGRHRLDYRRPG